MTHDLPVEVRQHINAFYNPEWNFAKETLVFSRDGSLPQSLYGTVVDYAREVYRDVSRGQCPFFVKRQLQMPLGVFAGRVTFMYERETRCVEVLLSVWTLADRDILKKQVAAAAAVVRHEIASHIPNIKMIIYPLYSHRDPVKHEVVMF